MPQVETVRRTFPHGTGRAVAKQLRIAESYVSAVITGDARPKTARARKTVRRIQVALARKLRLPVEEVFPPDDPASTT